MAVRENEKTELKAWSTPTIRRLSAGSAESGSGTIPDGGPPAAGTDRS